MNKTWKSIFRSRTLGLQIFAHARPLQVSQRVLLRSNYCQMKSSQTIADFPGKPAKKGLPTTTMKIEPFSPPQKKTDDVRRVRALGTGTRSATTKTLIARRMECGGKWLAPRPGINSITRK